MNYFENPDFLFKIVLIGNSAVGKSSLLKTVSEHYWDKNFTPTIGVDFKIETFQIDNKQVKLQIWDTAGQERFKSITRSYYKGSHGIIFVYDITDRASFQEIENWVEDVQKAGGDRMIKILVGNKCDLEDERRVSYEEGKKLAEQLGMKFIESSAKTNYNVLEAFHSLGRDMKQKFERGEGNLQKEKAVLIQPESERNNKSALCCYYM